MYVKAHLCIECNHWVRIETVIKQEATYSSTGLEEINFICSNCGTHDTKTVIIPEKSSSCGSSGSSSDSSSDSGSDSGGGSDGGGGTDW